MAFSISPSSRLASFKTAKNLGPYRYTQQFGKPFSFSTLYRYPDEPLSTSDQGRPRKQIAIIGAGAAGLSAAYELTRRGHKVKIFESTDRSGGRILTHRFSDGNHAELGAMRIPANHACTLHYVQEFGLAIRPFVNHNPDAYYFLRNIKTRIRDFSRLFSAFNLQPDEHGDPLLLYEALMKEIMAALSPEEKWEMFSSSFESSTLQQYNATSFWQYLRHRLSREAYDLVGHATGMIQYERASLLEVLIDYFGLFRVDQYELVDGMDALVNAFVQQLPGKICYNAKVRAIQMTDTGVRAHWSRFGRQEVDCFDYVICTVPAPALARINFHPALPANQMQAIRSITYASSAKTIFHTTARPWELYDNIYGGGSFTDLPIQQCWYPSDNSKPADTALHAAFTGDDQIDYSEAPLHWSARNPELSHSSAAFTASYLWEGNARRFLALDRQERTDLVLRNVKMLHPQIDQYVDEIVHYAWDEQSNPGYGAFAYFAPGEHERYQGPLCQPYPLDNPRVFFAGEHLALAHAWIQGAIQTGLDAAISVLQAPAPQQQAEEELAS